MIWGYSKGQYNHHLFGEPGLDGFYDPLCNKFKAFAVNEIPTSHIRTKDVCFECLLLWIQGGEKKP